MTELLSALGFTTLESIIWNLAAYAAFVVIIVGVLHERLRNILLTVGGAVLALYSGVFLKDALFATLQTLLTISGVMQLAHIKRGTSIATMLALTTVALVLLVLIEVLQNENAFAGVGGLLGITFGIVLLPRPSAFALMTLGGILLIVYAWTAGLWVFFFLNIFFVLANTKKLIQSSK